MFAIPVILAILSATVDASAATRPDASPSAGPILPSGTRAPQTPAVREVPQSSGTPVVPKTSTDNSAAPPSNDKTTEPRNVDRGGTPRPDRSAAPEQMSDVPLSPPVAPPAEPRPQNSGGGPDKVNSIH